MDDGRLDSGRAFETFTVACVFSTFIDNPRIIAHAARNQPTKETLNVDMRPHRHDGKPVYRSGLNLLHHNHLRVLKLGPISLLYVIEISRKKYGERRHRPRRHHTQPQMTPCSLPALSCRVSDDVIVSILLFYR